MEATTLSQQHVVQVFRACLFQPGDDPTIHTVSEGIELRAEFDPYRLESHRSKIEEMLDELPEAFTHLNGGTSFLQACVDRHGREWTRHYQVMEMLFVLGLAIGKVECLTPRELWKALPGSMPYYVIN